MAHEIFGISSNGDNKFQDKFNCLFEDNDAFYESKETFHHEDETSFDYKFCVEIIDLEYATGEEEDKNKYGIELAIVPMFHSLCDKQKKSILDCSCITEDEVNTRDTYQEGCSIMIGYEEVVVSIDDFESGKGFEGCEPIMSRLNAIANIFECVNSLRGFYLDKPQNAIGTTGWDLIEDYINGVDFVKATLDRYKE